MVYSYPSKGRVKTRLAYWTRHPYAPRWSWGLWFGWFYAAACSLYVIGAALLKRSTYFSLYDVSLWRILILYWIAGTLAGVVLALAYPLASNRIGSVVLGFFVGLTVYSTTALGMLGLRPFTFVAALVPAVLIGAGLGLVFYDEVHPQEPKAAS
jgi:hypothetical protein